MKKLLYVLIIAVVAIAVVVFVNLNQQSIAVQYIGGLHWEGQLSLLVIAAFVLGAVVGMLLLMLTTLRLKGRLIKANRENKKLARVQS